jgi:ADP-L-glycero-D-manno-heptose 6-epimerase
MIILTGAAGFIGSCMVRQLNEEGRMNLVLVDDFGREDKNRNLRGKNYLACLDRTDLFEWIERMHASIEAVIHLGARTDTTEQDQAIFDELNLHYSQRLWTKCAQYGLPLLYASSAATYGLGELGYIDRHELCAQLQPLNPYGRSKNDFDIWALAQEKQPPFWAGFKFFNVYGPNEYHKGRMASVVMHASRQIKASGTMKLFRSHRPDFQDGEQSRDFIYVKDVVKVLSYFLQKKPQNGIFNLGTGQARSFLDLVKATFQALDLEAQISFIDTPEDIRDTYQYFTEAEMGKLLAAGYTEAFYSLEDGVRDYVRGYLAEGEVIW